MSILVEFLLLKRQSKFILALQIEMDYVSEWLLTVKEVDTVMTSGVGVSVMGMPIWIWEGSEEPFSFQNWWPGNVTTEA